MCRNEEISRMQHRYYGWLDDGGSRNILRSKSLKQTLSNLFYNPKMSDDSVPYLHRDL